VYLGCGVVDGFVGAGPSPKWGHGTDICGVIPPTPHRPRFLTIQDDQYHQVRRCQKIRPYLVLAARIGDRRGSPGGRSSAPRSAVRYRVRPCRGFVAIVGNDLVTGLAGAQGLAVGVGVPVPVEPGLAWLGVERCNRAPDRPSFGG
jgi:hypothetical protein